MVQTDYKDSILWNITKKNNKISKFRLFISFVYLSDSNFNVYFYS
jgi:hypothetical protein